MKKIHSGLLFNNMFDNMNPNIVNDCDVILAQQNVHV